MPEVKKQLTEEEKVSAMFHNVVRIYLPYADEVERQVEEFKNSHPDWHAYYSSGHDPTDAKHASLPELTGIQQIEVEISADQLGEISTLAATISQILSAATPTRTRWDTRNNPGSLGRREGYNRRQSYTFIPLNIRSFRPK